MSTEMDEPVSPLERDLSLCVLVPGRLEDRITVHGSKPVMDLLVTLCASYHLNPADYSVEFLSPNKNSISFKPNSPVGSLEAEKIVLKLKGSEEKEKVKKPYVPEATVRLLINYNQAHRTVLRVNPTLPLEALLQPMCDKCEFNVETTVLLRDSRSREPLDLRKTLNEHGLREVFARDTAPRRPSDPRLQTAEAADDISPPPLQDLPKKGKKDKSRGFFSLFRRRKNQDGVQTLSAPVSPGPNKPAGVRVSSRSASASNTLHADPSKKRPAPPPPVAASHSVPSDLSSCHIQGAEVPFPSGHDQDTKSAESPLRNTKRRAPPPPCANTVQEPREDADVGETLNPVEELKEAAEPHVEPSQPWSSSLPSHPLPSLSSWRQSLAHLQQDTDLHLPSFRGKDLCDARCALAKVLTSSVSKGALVKRFRNSASFTKFHVSSCVSVTPDNEDVCAELESVFSSNLPTDGWEEPAQRSGLTTFKVVPPTKLTVDESDQSHASQDGDPGSQSSSEVEKNHLENKDPGSPDGSEGEHTEQRNDTSPAPPPQLHSEPRFPPDTPVSEGGDACRNQVEEEVEDSKNQVEEEVEDSKNQVEEEVEDSKNQVEEEADASENQVEEEVEDSENQVEEEADASENQVQEEVEDSKNQVEEEADASENQVEEEEDAIKNQVEEEADSSKNQVEEEANTSKNQVEADASENQVEEEADTSKNQVEEEADVSKNQVEEEADASKNQVEEEADSSKNQVEEEADDSENQVEEEVEDSKNQVEEEADTSENQVEEEADASENQVEEEADSSKNQVEEEADASKNQVEEEADASKNQMEEEADASKNQVEEEADASKNQVEEEADASKNQVEEEADDSKNQVEEEADASKNQVEEEADASKNQMEEEADASKNQVEEEADASKNQVEEEADASKNQVEEEADDSKNQVEEEADASENQVEEEADASENQVEEEADASENQVEEAADIRSEVEVEEPGCSDGGPAADLASDGKNTEILPEDESEEEVSFPPPPPPVFFREDAEVTETEDSTFPPAPPAVGGAPADLTSGRPEPPDRRNGAPSQFAQAVAMAVQRSRLQSLSKGPHVPRGPPTALQSPPRSTYQYGA